ncbi:hypothetical protein MRX96_017747 [Rhipicephalus microplus]
MTATDIEAAVRSPVPVLNVRIPHPPSPAIITFASTQLPEHVDIGFVQHKVHMYVDRPPRCKLCGRIGHVMAVCTHQSPTFSKGTSGAPNGEISDPKATGQRQRCLNCGQEDHDTRSKMCPRWLELIEVSRHRRTSDLDIRTARTTRTQEARSPAVRDERRPQNSSVVSRGLLALRTARSAASMFLQRTFIVLVRIIVEPVRSFATTYFERFTKPAGNGLFRPWENQSVANLPFVVKQQKEMTELSG